VCETFDIKVKRNRYVSTGNERLIGLGYQGGVKMTQFLEELLRVVYEISIHIDMMSKLVGGLETS
jgi:hypothetical protein